MHSLSPCPRCLHCAYGEGPVESVRHPLPRRGLVMPKPITLAATSNFKFIRYLLFIYVGGRVVLHSPLLLFILPLGRQTGSAGEEASLSRVITRRS